MGFCHRFYLCLEENNPASQKKLLKQGEKSRGRNFVFTQLKPFICITSPGQNQRALIETAHKTSESDSTKTLFAWNPSSNTRYF